VQPPFEQLEPMPLEHTFPHWPQLSLSIITFVHPLEHAVSPPGHSQFPSLHEAPETQLIPQTPQLFESVSTFTHVPEQTVPPGQVQLPFEQTSPDA
jgi:hypothetical protein